MTPTQPIRAARARLVVACLATLALALAACSGANPSASPSASVSSSTAAEPSASQAPTVSQAPSASQAPASQVASARCALTPDASPSATVQWNSFVQGSPTIKAGQAVTFITQSGAGPTVTEGTVNWTAVADACIDELLVARLPLVVTFYQPGDYNIFCRMFASNMRTVVHVQ